MMKRNARVFCCFVISSPAIVVSVTTNKSFVAFRVAPELKRELQTIADCEARSVSQICEMLLREGVEGYKKDGSKYLQRLVAKQKQLTK